MIQSRHYALEVVQHPQRARMCGFGDKVQQFQVVAHSGPTLNVPTAQDRRPLAPAAVARMVVRREDNSIVDVE